MAPLAEAGPRALDIRPGDCPTRTAAVEAVHIHPKSLGEMAHNRRDDEATGPPLGFRRNRRRDGGGWAFCRGGTGGFGTGFGVWSTGG